MCFFTLEIELWEKLWQMLHVLPLSVLMTYFLKSSGDWTSYEPKMCRLINNEKLIKSCTFISRKNTTFFCFCAGSCVCPAPFWFPQLLHTLYRNMRSCLGNACFLCGSSHCIRIYEKIHGKDCRFCHFQLWRCTVWSHLETEVLKWNSIYFTSVNLFTSFAIPPPCIWPCVALGLSWCQLLLHTYYSCMWMC